MTTEPYGEWAWVHHCEIEPDLSQKFDLPAGDSAIALPPGFTARLAATGLLSRVNHQFGTLLDFYEEEDIGDPRILCFVAGSLAECFHGHELQARVQDLISFLLTAASSGQCVTFRL